jgi:D-arabinan exo alpha-(1,3)/(1,5)-arabinofuranosidase (non-reducing end)
MTAMDRKHCGALQWLAGTGALALWLAGCQTTPEPKGDPATLSSMSSGVGTLPMLTSARTRSISAENLTGAKGQGGMAIPNPSEPKPAASARAADNLGQGWKVKPFLRVNAGETVTLMDVDGPGTIQHIWMVEGLSRASILRFYWDNEPTPSVEVPVPDFFAVGHEMFARVNSQVVIVNPANALNCYWPMPFRRHARITFSNEGPKDLELLAFQINYALAPIPKQAGYFHAQWRRADTSQQNPYVILDGVRGKGRYAGTFLAWTQRTKGWFGEGEIKFFMDGDGKFPTICGTGTEDYFCGSYGFQTPYSTAYTGTVLPADADHDPPNYWSLYRWHILDPICFDKDLKVTIQALGWGSDGKYKLLSDDIASVAYWYQAEPHAPFPLLPPLERRGRTK